MSSDPAEERIVGSGARLSGGPSDLLSGVAFAAETEGYADLWRWISIADLAHVRELLASRLIGPDTASRLLFGLFELHNHRQLLDPGAGDIVNNRDRLLRPIVGDAAGHLHTGRARREATTVAWHLATRHALEEAAAGVARLVEALTETARVHTATLMSDFTYLQHAQPTTLAHYLLTFAEPLVRDLGRFESAFGRVNQSPAGCGSTNGSSFAIDRQHLAASMEFSSLLRHCRDAMWAPDLAIEVMSSVLSAFVTVDRLAEELQIWCSSEFGFFTVSDRHARTSVTMPQKRNPYGLAMIRGMAREQLGSFVATVATNLTPTGQPDNRVYSYGAVPRAATTLAGAASLLAEILAEGDFDREMLVGSAHDGFTMATDLCDYLTVEHGLSNRDSHRLVGGAVRHAQSEGHDRLSISDLAKAADEVGTDPPAIDPDALEAIQEPASVIARRLGVGSLSDTAAMIEGLAAAARFSPRAAGFEQRFLNSTHELAKGVNR